MPTPTRRTVLTGTAATAALLTLPARATAAEAAAETTPEASRSYRWRNAVTGGEPVTGSVTLDRYGVAVLRP
ncbi:hypothetical protein ACIQB5_26705 [Streptomyces sp. NPDC088560]|uniref:hypothetical protein n=1 Tax=Streptomyces sp. NPDC088560 TaxID=3365868 RepID=UPI0038276102